MSWTVGTGRPQGTDGGCLDARTRESCSSSPARTSVTFRLIALFSLAFACALFWPSAAQAATWPLATSALSASCGYHETYTAGGTTYTHSGMDVPGTAGGTVSSPLSGTVTYVGSVPNGDSRVGTSSGSGQTMKAVSVKIADGRTITLMPIASVAVSRGDAVSEGEAIGTLAATGDVSTSGVHLHMGLKKGSTYQDPMTLFGATSTSAGASSQTVTISAAIASTSAAASTLSTASATSTATEGATATDGVTADSAVSTTSPAHETESAAARAADGATVTEGAGVSVGDAVADVSAAGDTASQTAYDTASDAASGWGTISSGEASYSPTASEDATLLQQVAGILVPIQSACLSQLSALTGALKALSAATGLPLAVLSIAIGIACVAALTGLALLAVKRVAPMVRARFSGAFEGAVPIGRRALAVGGSGSGRMGGSGCVDGCGTGGSGGGLTASRGGSSCGAGGGGGLRGVRARASSLLSRDGGR